MVSKTDQILDDMRACTPAEKIDESSKSSWYNAFSIWKPEAEATYKKITNDIKAANIQKTIVYSETEQGNADLGDVRQALVDEKAELEKTQSTDAALKEHVNELQARSNAFESRLADLERRGITESTIEAVASTDAASDIELLARVKTAKDAQELAKGNEILEAKKIELTNGVSQEAAKLVAAKQETQTELNRRDEFRRLYAVYLMLLDLLFDFYRRGYTDVHFKMLLNGLKKLEIIGQPRTSIARLLNALQKIRTLEELDAAIQVMQATLATLQSKINELQGIIIAYRDGAIASLNQVSTTGTKKMEALLNQHIASMNTLSQHQQGQLSKLEADAESKLARISQSAQAQASSTNDSMGILYLNISSAFKVYHGEVSKWGAMKAETGKFQAELKWGQYIQQLNSDPKLAANMSTSLALQMADWLHIWVGKHLPEAKSLPPEHLSKQESGLSRFFSVKFTNITEWVRYELRDLQKRGVI